MTITDAQINTKYESGINRLTTEQNKIKLPKLVENIKYNPEAAHSRRSSSSTTRGHTPSLIMNFNWSSSWNETTKSRLIESLLINIPVTPIVVFEKAYHSYELIDGRERINTIVDFYSDRITLTGLEIETDLEGYTYSTLPVRVKYKLDNRSLNLINCIPMSNNQSESEIKKLIDIVKERYSR